MHTKHILGSLLLAVLPLGAAAQYRSQVWCPDNGDGTYTNPVINADYSDPDVVAVGDDYYLTSSSFSCTPGLPVLHSRDLVNWEIIGHALDRVLPDSMYSGRPQHGNGVWAPSIRHHNGRFYIYWGDPDNGVFMVRATHPAGPWEPPVLVIPGKGIIDTTPLWDDDGRCYLVNAWANSRSRFASVITVRELNAEGTRAIGRPVIVFDGNGTENHTCEGPKFYKRDGWYWIMCPAGGVPTGFQLAMRARSPFGPYEVRKVLAQGDSPVNGPHQGAWVHTKYGEDWFLHFQDKGPYGRVVHLQPVTWRDNWPVMGRVPVHGYCGTPCLTHRMPKAAAHTITNPAESDEFNEPRLSPQWQWQANYDATFGMPTALGFFRLYTHKSDLPLWHTPSLLLQKTPADRFTATARLKLVGKAEGQMGGLVMMGLDYSALVVRRVADRFELRQITCHNADKGKPETVRTLATLPPTGRDETDYQFAIHEDIYMRMNVCDGRLQFAYSRDGRRFTPVGEPFAMREGKWVGARMGFVAQEPAGNANRGWVDADWFRVTPLENAANKKDRKQAP